MITKPKLSQLGMNGWEKHYEWFVTCGSCGTVFLSNTGGAVRCNGETHNDCPYCKNPLGCACKAEA